MVVIDPTKSSVVCCAALRGLFAVGVEVQAEFRGQSIEHPVAGAKVSGAAHSVGIRP